MQTIKRRRLGAESWRELLARFADGGQTARAFCLREAVSTASFYRCRALLGMAPGRRDLARALPANMTPNAFVDLGTLGAPSVHAERVELRLDLGGGLTLQLVRG